MAASCADIPLLTDLKGKRVLVVEDEHLVAADLARMLIAKGAEVIGPFSTISEATRYLSNGQLPDLVMLDINLRGEMVFPVADHLMAARVPCIFVTGYDRNVLPARYAAVSLLEKPVDLLCSAEAICEDHRRLSADSHLNPAYSTVINTKIRETNMG